MLYWASDLVALQEEFIRDKCVTIRRRLCRRRAVIEMDLRETRKEAVNWIHLVQDRSHGLSRTQ
jgi:hypothetical protein